MRSVLKFAAGVAALAAVSGPAFAVGTVNLIPEPGSLALVGVAVAALVGLSRKGKK